MTWQLALTIWAVGLPLAAVFCGRAARDTEAEHLPPGLFIAGAVVAWPLTLVAVILMGCYQRAKAPAKPKGGKRGD